MDLVHESGEAELYSQAKVDETLNRTLEKNNIN